ncbi:MAG: hypothetical protein LQ340_000128 [Diploschistes diacapsis]|nr:MAG: hypothetical protein LQ340_000128 [Diploschistes diacapsis]
MNINELPNNRGLVLPWTKASHRTDIDDSKVAARLPFLKYLPWGSRGHFVAVLGEFIGTFLFLFFAFGATQIANTNNQGTVTDSSEINRLLFISLAFGFSLAVNAWTFFRISGGLFNPAVTLGMCLIGALTWLRGGLLFVTQMLGAMCAAAVVSALLPGPLTVQTTLGGNTSLAQGLFIEMFLTVQLVFTIFMLAAEKHKATFIAPVGIFAPCVVQRGFPNYHWIYWLGPALGSCLSALVYRIIKMLEYETANPDQDDDGEPQAVTTPEGLATTGSNSSPQASTLQGQGFFQGNGYQSGPGMEDARKANRPD